MGGIIEWIVQQALQKTANGFVAKGEITQSQADEMVAGTMVELELGLKLYQQNQQATAVATPPVS